MKKQEQIDMLARRLGQLENRSAIRQTTINGLERRVGILETKEKAEVLVRQVQLYRVHASDLGRRVEILEHQAKEAEDAQRKREEPPTAEPGSSRRKRETSSIPDTNRLAPCGYRDLPATRREPGGDLRAWD